MGVARLRSRGEDPPCMATDRPLVLLWIHDAAPCRQGLARCAAMLAFRAGAGVLAQMPRLRSPAPTSSTSDGAS
jgi:hypothetical protein